MGNGDNYLALLHDYEVELCNAIQGLAGKGSREAVDRYIFQLAAQLARWIDGFLCLRANGRDDASRLIVRPCIEATLRIEAVKNKPELFYQIAFDENKEDEKILRTAPAAIRDKALPALAKLWEDFRTTYRAAYPAHALVEAPLSTWEVAETAGRSEFYNTDYRLYCQFTHGALRAVIGGYDETMPDAAHVLCLCALAALTVLASFEAPAPNLGSLNDRLSGIDRKRV